MRRVVPLLQLGAAGVSVADRNLALLESLVAPDLERSSPWRKATGLKHFQNEIQEILTATTDLRLEIDKMRVSEDLVSTEWTLRGRFQDLEDKDERGAFQFRGATVGEVREGRIVSLSGEHLAGKAFEKARSQVAGDEE